VNFLKKLFSMQEKEKRIMNMFCYQCEQTAQGRACSVQGICGKDPVTASLQDLTIYALKGLSMYAHRLREIGIKDHDMLQQSKAYLRLLPM